MGAKAAAGATQSFPAGAPGAHSAVASGAAAIAEHNAMPAAHNPAQAIRVLVVNRELFVIDVDSF
jgi:hypothetical protein